MNDREKQIEAMASDWCRYRLCGETACVPKENSAHECHYSMNKAIALNALGYCKIPEGSVVLSKEEYEQLCKDKNDYKQRYQSLNIIHNDLLASSCKALANDKDQARKQAVKEFVEELLDTKTKILNDHYIYAENIKVIAKEKFGVEIKE